MTTSVESIETIVRSLAGKSKITKAEVLAVQARRQEIDYYISQITSLDELYALLNVLALNLVYAYTMDGITEAHSLASAIVSSLRERVGRIQVESEASLDFFNKTIGLSNQLDNHQS